VSVDLYGLRPGETVPPLLDSAPCKKCRRLLTGREARLQRRRYIKGCSTCTPDVGEWDWAMDKPLVFS